jgi:hypothetical protein
MSLAASLERPLTSWLLVAAAPRVSSAAIANLDSPLLISTPCQPHAWAPNTR